MNDAPTKPPGPLPSVADVYLLALSELTRTVVEQGDLTRAAVADCTQHVLALSVRLDVVESAHAKLKTRIERIERELGIAV